MVTMVTVTIRQVTFEIHVLQSLLHVVKKHVFIRVRACVCVCN